MECCGGGGGGGIVAVRRDPRMDARAARAVALDGVVGVTEESVVEGVVAGEDEEETGLDEYSPGCAKELAGTGPGGTGSRRAIREDEEDVVDCAVDGGKVELGRDEDNEKEDAGVSSSASACEEDPSICT